MYEYVCACDCVGIVSVDRVLKVPSNRVNIAVLIDSMCVSSDTSEIPASTTKLDKAVGYLQYILRYNIYKCTTCI